MIKAAAVRIHLPSPSGFFGIGVTGKLSSVRRGVVAAATIFLGLAEEKAAVREGVFLRPLLESLSRGRVLKMAPLFKSRFIQQPGSGSLTPSSDHPSCS